MNYKNPIYHTDCYKTGHRKQYPEGTEYVYSNLTPRSDKIARRNNDVLLDFDGKVVFLGLQGFIQEFLIESFNEHFFSVDKETACKEYKHLMDAVLGVDAVTVEHFEELHDLGYLPIQINALEEGTRVPIGVPMLTIVNTHPKFYWLTNYLETVMSAELWQACTSATIANEYRRLLTRYAVATGAPVDFVGLQGHDFSFRGMNGRQGAINSAIGHLTSFIGTDTIPAIPYLMQYYDASYNNLPVGVSVPATEHSVMCLGGKEDEIETFRELIVNKYPSGIVSIVSDTWDYWKVLTEFLPALKFEILDRVPDVLGLAKTVIRPDSGDPVHIVAGYEVGTEVIELGEGLYYFIDDLFYDTIDDLNGGYVNIKKGATAVPEHVVKGSIEVLWDTFGGTETYKGYKVLNERIGLIYGDSITLSRAQKILRRLEAKGFASNNIVFGIGSYTYQYNTRDTFGFAVKATWGQVSGESRDIFKDPKTDSGTKKSAKGLLRVYDDPEKGLTLCDMQTKEQEKTGLLKTVFLDGVTQNQVTFDQIRNNVQTT